MSRAQVKPRNRLYSDTSDEIPKSILKKPRIPTKRSVSECVDDLSDIMTNLNLNISDLPQSRGEFCYHNIFYERDEEGGDDDDSGSDNEDHEQKKFVRFDDKVYETVFLASKLYDKRSMTKYHFSSRHHPPEQQNKRKTKKSPSAKVDEQTAEVSCKQSKSQRSKQSKRDKKKRLNKRDDTNDTGSGDDQGYHSSSHQSFSD